MQEKGHEFFIVARDKDCTFQLLDSAGLPYVSRGKGSSGILGRVFYMLRTDATMVKQARKFNPHLFISFGSPYLAHAAFLLRKPHVVFDDTDHNPLVQLLYKPFTRAIAVPSCYTNKKTHKHITFNSYLELAYLHPNYFTPDTSITAQLGLSANTQYVILRFVSHKVVHDIGKRGITNDVKIRTVTEFSKYARVFVSSETELPDVLKSFAFPLPPEKMHDALAYASLLYGDSASMAAEAAVLGIPAIYADQKGTGYTDELEARYGLVFNYPVNAKSIDGSIQKGIEILQNNAGKEEFQQRRQQMLNEKIDTTEFMVKFVETR